MIDIVQFSTGLTTGGAGAASAIAYSPPIQGEIIAVHVNYDGSPPATTDLTLSDENDPAAESIITLANQASDIKLYPRRILEDNTGADLTYDGTYKVHGPYTVHGRLKVTIAQANDNNSAYVTVWYRK